MITTMQSPGEDYSDRYDPDVDFDRWYTNATAAIIAPRLEQRSHALELGCATGLMTSMVAGHAAHIVAVDRSTEYLERARRRCLPNVSWVHSDIATYRSSRRFDHILATNVLHEVEDPETVLAGCRELMAGDGQLHLSLQNPYSLHRLIALEMGLIDSLHTLSERGHQFGSRRLFDADQLVGLAAKADFRLVDHKGVMLKPLPNSLMASLGTDILQGFAAAAKYLPDHCAMNYLCFSPV